jgi:hypothetical protein
MARIHAPLLDSIGIVFFNQLILDIAYLPLFISFAENFQGIYEAVADFHADFVKVTFRPQETTVNYAFLIVTISCRELDWQLSSLAQVCSSASPPSCTLEGLDITENHYRPPHWQDDMEPTQWLELLRPLTSLKELYLSGELVLRVVPALQGLANDEIIEVLPVLQYLFAGNSESELVQEAIGIFLAARQACGHPVELRDPEIESGMETASDDSSDYDSMDDELE